MWAIGAAYGLLRHAEGLGGGDIKLAGALGAWLGFAKIPFFLLGAFASGVVVMGLFLALSRGERSAPLPFGPFLAASAALFVLMPQAHALLAQLIAAQRSGSGFGPVAEVPLGCLARLQSALSTKGVAPEAGLVDPLTSRELEVLQMLAVGTSNQAIASQLVVTLDTVKKHVSHVLSKLGAANRTEAVARARELSLIP